MSSTRSILLQTSSCLVDIYGGKMGGNIQSIIPAAVHERFKIYVTGSEKTQHIIVKMRVCVAQSRWKGPHIGAVYYRKYLVFVRNFMWLLSLGVCPKPFASSGIKSKVKDEDALIQCLFEPSCTKLQCSRSQVLPAIMLFQHRSAIIVDFFGPFEPAGLGVTGCRTTNIPHCTHQSLC